MRQEKQFLLDEVKEQIEEKPSFIITQYERIGANSMGSFRDGIAKLGGDVHMIRKRILVKAASEAGVELDIAQLPGHIGIVFAGEDAIETTKAIFEFSKETDKAMQVLGGRIDGQLYSAADVEKLSKLPGVQEMRAQLLAVLEAPLSQTVAVMDSLLTSILYLLDNKAKKES